MAFRELAEVDAWVEDPENGGENGLREALARGGFGNDQRSIGLAREWLYRRESERLEEKQLKALSAAERSAKAAEYSARWTLLAAVVAAIAAAASWAQIFFTRPPA